MNAVSPVNQPSIDPCEIHALLGGRHADPFRVLGPHRTFVEGKTWIAIRALVPDAETVSALIEERGGWRTEPLARVDPGGFFEGLFPGDRLPRYRLRARHASGVTWDFDDPYRFGVVLGELDLHLLGEGTHYRSFDRLGAHRWTIDGVEGVFFAVWAPNADRVSVVGSFNGWDGRRHPMRNRGASGFWELFVPGLADGDIYKFEIRTRDGHLRLKSDPHGHLFEYRPSTASVVCDLDRYSWGDQDWLERRSRRHGFEEPLAIYEVHLGSWMRVPEEGGRFLTYRELAPRLADYAVEMGFTHLELLPVQEHPLDSSWGYQSTGYFAPTSRHGSPRDLMYFVDYCHRRGLGVILDWVPAHFPKDDYALRYFDGTHLYEHADPRQGEHRDWGTLIFNYARKEVRNFLLSSALFWIEKFHFDGLRVDAVASMLYLDYSRTEGDWLPNEYGGKENIGAIEFLKTLNILCHQHHPGILTIAEESTAWGGVSRPTYTGGLGFSMKWNMGWMNDTLSYFAKEPVHRKFHHQNLTFSLLYAFSENFILPLSHDEVVHGKRSLLDRMPGDGWQKFANLRLLFGFQYSHPGKKLIFMGGEFGMGREWDAERSIDWHLLDIDSHRGVQRFVRDLNRVYRQEPALHQVDFSWEGFEWIDFHDWEQSIIAFVRRSREPRQELVVAINFTPVPRGSYRLGVPGGGFYREVLNSDSAHYGGSGMGNLGGVQAEPVSSHGRSFSLPLTIPPLAIVVLKREG
jgi:1,4-alpha-glucan branching enzyme